MAILRTGRILQFLIASILFDLCLGSFKAMRAATYESSLSPRLINNTDNAVPGGSPFTYVDDPANDLFKFDTLTMNPGTCYIGSGCEFKATVEVSEDLASLEVLYNIQTYFKDGSHGMIQGGSDLCGWVIMTQGGVKQCPPKKGTATMSMEMGLPRGFIREGKYVIDLHATSGEETAFHIAATVELTSIDQSGSPVIMPSTVPNNDCTS